MNWQNVSYSWIEVLPGLLLLGWVYSEVRHLRRLRILGDPMVMGVSASWALRIAALAALLAGVACAAAVVPLAGLHATNAGVNKQVIEILMDTRSMEGLEDSAWEAFDSSMQILFDQAQGARFSAIAFGVSSEVLVYPTVDTQGLLTILARLHFRAASEGKPELREALEKYAAAKDTELSSSRRVILTALPTDEVERITDSLAPPLRDVLFAQISNDGGAIKYLRRDPSGMPVWTTRATEIQNFLRSEADPAKHFLSLDTTQWFALAAILLLSLEYVCRLFGRSSKGRYHFA
jgi:hypothetical protein